MKFDPSKLPYEAFGGFEYVKKFDDEIQKIEKNHNAYVLIY